MAYDYDALYKETPNALGEPSKRIVEFFEALAPKPLDVLDVGCGQGRDALFIARLGHRVCGVDVSPNGIRDLERTGASEGLSITGIVADIRSFRPLEPFDVVLIDRTLHMLEPPEQLATLKMLLDFVRPEGFLLIVDEKPNVAAFKQTIETHAAAWYPVYEKAGWLFMRRAPENSQS